jgi:serine/threonine-protein kinase
VFVTDDGTIKILDFGIAKLEAGTLLTTAGASVGTVAYMSPEQTRGEQVDRRTDIWSLGVVLYQMLSGHLPFHGGHEQAVIYSIQNTDPPQLPAPAIPSPCQDILAKALQKDPGRRYQSMKELLADLGTVQKEIPSDKPRNAHPTTSGAKRRTIFIGGGAVLALLIAICIFFLQRYLTTESSSASSPPLRRLAVLPLANLRSDPQTDFLGFALADQIIGNLAYVKTLIVRPSNAIRRYQTETPDPASAGENSERGSHPHGQLFEGIEHYKAQFPAC